MIPTKHIQMPGDTLSNINEPGFTPVLFLRAEYTSVWEEGDIVTPAILRFINNSVAIETTVAEDGDDYEHHIRSEINLTLNSVHLSFELNEDDELLEEDSLKIMTELSSQRVVLSETECPALALRDMPASLRQEISTAIQSKSLPDPLSTSAEFVIFQTAWFSVAQLHDYSDDAPSAVPHGWSYCQLSTELILVAMRIDNNTRLRVGLIKTSAA